MQLRRRTLLRLVALMALVAASTTQAFIPSLPRGSSSASATAAAAATKITPTTTTTLQAAAVTAAPPLTTTTTTTSTPRTRRRPRSSSTPTTTTPTQATQPTTHTHTQTDADVKAVQRAALAIQKQRTLAKELGRPPTMEEISTALGGLTEESLRRVLERGSVARASLVKGWEGLVMKFVGKYAQTLSDTELADLMCEGQLGVLDAAVRFQGGQGAEFKTYVYYWVRKRVLEAGALYDRTTLGTGHDARQAALVKQAISEHERTHGGDQLLSSKDIAAKVGLPVARVEELTRRGQKYGLMERSMAGYVKYQDTLQDEQGVSDQGSALESIYLTEVEQVVRNALAALPEEERKVLSYRLGLADGQPKSWEELSRLMEGCSVSYLRKVEMKAKTHLRRNVDMVKLIHRRPASLDGEETVW